jgi:hypothetical protein
MHTWMDARVAKGRGKMECDTADARGPYRRGRLGGILAERRAAGVGFTRQDGAAVVIAMLPSADHTYLVCLKSQHVSHNS